jgi:hypothetical protein
MKTYSNKIILLSILIITSCNIRRDIVSSSKLSKLNLEGLISKINNNTLNSKWVSVKGKVKMNSSKEKISLGINMKIRKDSLIWFSITAPIIGEINRIMITEDSIYYINRTNSTWMTQPIDYIKEKLNAEFSYALIQDIVTRSISLPNNDYLSKKEGKKYLIENSVDSNRYIINISDEYLEEANLNFKDNSIKIRYIGTQELNNKNYPKNLIIETSNKELNFDVTYSKIYTKIIDKISFKIPKSYNEIK